MRFVCACLFVLGTASACDFKADRAFRVSDWPWERGILRPSAPVYPPLARRLKRQGRVTVSVLLNYRGDVRKICSTGDPLLRKAAEEAVSRWRFRVPEFVRAGRLYEAELIVDYQLGSKLGNSAP